VAYAQQFFARLRCGFAWLSWPLWLTLLVGCASVEGQPGLPVRALLHDELFESPRERVDASDLFALNDRMRRYADNELRIATSWRDPRRALIEALHERGQLRLAYDATRTGNAAETFEARSGNCLSLVVMTGAFARHLGLPFTFRAVRVEPQYTRTGGLTLENGHVNLLMAQMGERPLWGGYDLVVDFLPAEDLRGQQAQALSENTVVAMFMNNRAAEALTEGRINDGYAWARASLAQDPTYAAAANTLAVVYMRRGHLPFAEAALRHTLALETDNMAALSNLSGVLRQSGRAAEAETVAARLAQLQPYPPFHFLELGRLAMEQGDAAKASELFARELRRQPFQHEVHFWAAQAFLSLGDVRRAAVHLRQAMDYSPTVANQQAYSAKLDHLRALNLQ
jgi:Tfp pilus assembly protein PilF